MINPFFFVIVLALGLVILIYGVKVVVQHYRKSSSLSMGEKNLDRAVNIAFGGYGTIGLGIGLMLFALWSFF